MKSLWPLVQESLWPQTQDLWWLLFCQKLLFSSSFLFRVFPHFNRLFSTKCSTLKSPSWYVLSPRYPGHGQQVCWAYNEGVRSGDPTRERATLIFSHHPLSLNPPLPNSFDLYFPGFLILGFHFHLPIFICFSSLVFFFFWCSSDFLFLTPSHKLPSRFHSGSHCPPESRRREQQVLTKESSLLQAPKDLWRQKAVQGCSCLSLWAVLTSLPPCKKIRSCSYDSREKWVRG